MQPRLERQAPAAAPLKTARYLRSRAGAPRNGDAWYLLGLYITGTTMSCCAQGGEAAGWPLWLRGEGSSSAHITGIATDGALEAGLAGQAVGVAGCWRAGGRSLWAGGKCSSALAASGRCQAHPPSLGRSTGTCRASTLGPRADTPDGYKCMGLWVCRRAGGWVPHAPTVQHSGRVWLGWKEHQKSRYQVGWLGRWAVSAHPAHLTSKARRTAQT